MASGKRSGGRYHNEDRSQAAGEISEDSVRKGVMDSIAALNCS